MLSFLLSVRESPGAFKAGDRFHMHLKLSSGSSRRKRLVKVQERDDGGLGQCGGGEDRQKSMDLKYFINGNNRKLGKQLGVKERAKT